MSVRYTLNKVMGTKSPLKGKWIARAKMIDVVDIEALAKEICRQTVYDWTTYDMSTDHFRSARHEILEALSK